MRLSPELCKSRVMPTVYLGIYRFCMIKLLYCVERNCGSASCWCRSGSGSDFPFWCRSRSGSGLASKQRRSTWSYRYPKLYTVQCTVGTCWKIGHFLDFYLRQCQSHQSQILHDFVFWTAYWNCHEKKIKKIHVLHSAWNFCRSGFGKRMRIRPAPISNPQLWFLYTVLLIFL